MATIRTRNGKYQVQVRRKGFAPISKSFLRLKEAKEWARLYEIKADREELASDRSELDKLSLGDLITRYLEEVVPRKKSVQIETIVLNAFLKDAICKKRLSSITTADFAAYRDARLKSVKPNSLKRQIAPIHNMFVVARDEWNIPIRENPLDKLKLNAPDQKRDRRLQQGEYERLLEAARARQNPWIEKVIIFAIETAMRRGEILSLRWSEVDLKRRSVTILEAKNGYSRTIPLTKRAYALMHGLERPTEYVFPITKDALKMAWGRMMKQSGLTDLRFHDLRHEAVSRFFEMGLTVPEVASISGHRDTKMLMRYAHASNHEVLRKFRNL